MLDFVGITVGERVRALCGACGAETAWEEHRFFPPQWSVHVHGIAYEILQVAERKRYGSIEEMDVDADAVVSRWKRMGLWDISTAMPHFHFREMPDRSVELVIDATADASPANVTTSVTVVDD